uniref:MORN repeat-containing protein 5 n=1 Tax=Zooxanthella nutricula TaxID=1333877 RepID=A0A7S2HG26_9DINO
MRGGGLLLWFALVARAWSLKHANDHRRGGCRAGFTCCRQGETLARACVREADLDSSSASVCGAFLQGGSGPTLGHGSWQSRWLFVDGCPPEAPGWSEGPFDMAAEFRGSWANASGCLDAPEWRRFARNHLRWALWAQADAAGGADKAMWRGTVYLSAPGGRAWRRYEGDLEGEDPHGQGQLYGYVLVPEADGEPGRELQCSVRRQHMTLDATSAGSGGGVHTFPAWPLAPKTPGVQSVVLYEGGFRRGLPHGRGSLTTPGRQYRGDFADGFFEGPGELKLRGDWEQDHLPLMARMASMNLHSVFRPETYDYDQHGQLRSFDSTGDVPFMACAFPHLPEELARFGKFDCHGNFARGVCQGFSRRLDRTGQTIFRGIENGHGVAAFSNGQPHHVGEHEGKSPKGKYFPGVSAHRTGLVHDGKGRIAGHMRQTYSG